jgi:hypothetical protein
MIKTHLAFCFWFQHRIRYDEKFKIYVEHEINKNTDDFNIVRLYKKIISNKIFYKNINESNITRTQNLNDFVEIYKEFNADNNFTLIIFTSYSQNPTYYLSWCA